MIGLIFDIGQTRCFYFQMTAVKHHLTTIERH